MRSGLVDRLCFSRANYWIGFALDVSVSLTLIVVGSATQHWPLVAAALLAGAVTFSFYEYVLHRWLYHALPNPVRRVHAAHHADPTRLVGAPFFYTLGVTALTFLLVHRMVGDAIGAVFAGTVLLGYACYESLHHLIHRRSFADGSWLARLQAHHLLHHRHPRANFGVTTRFWDRLFGTRVRSMPMAGGSDETRYNVRSRGGTL